MIRELFRYCVVTTILLKGLLVKVGRDSCLVLPLSVAVILLLSLCEFCSVCGATGNVVLSFIVFFVTFACGRWRDRKLQKK